MELLEYPTATVDTIRHFEDDSSWQRIIKRIAKDIGSHYVGTDSLDDSEINSLKAMTGPNVVIFDLALPEHRDRELTVKRICKLAPDLLQKNIKVIVLSAYSDEYQNYLVEAGIEEENLFLKDKFNDERLETILKRTQEELRFLPPPMSPNLKIGELSVHIHDAAKFSKGYILHANRDYILEVNLRSVTSENSSTGITGRYIRANLLGEFATIAPQARVLKVLQASQSSKAQFTVRFQKSMVDEYAELDLLLYHNNHLIRKIEIPIRVAP